MDYGALLPDEEWVISRVLERRAAEKPDHPFMHYDGRDYTYAALNREANRVAAGLRDLGVAPGDRVAVLMQSSPEYLYVWFAIAKLGAIEIPVNVAYKGAILTHVLTNSGTSAILMDDEFAGVVAEVAGDCPDLKTFVVNHVGEAGAAAPAGAHDLSEVARGEGENPGLEIRYTDIACIMFTSGTTGPSKGVLINHHFEWSFGVTFGEIARITADDVAYNYLPFFHVAGKFVLMAAMMVDARMLLTQRFSVSDFWADVRAHDVTVTVAVGGICHMLFAEPEQPDDADNPLRLFYAVPAPAEFQDEFEKRFGLVFIEGYGSTEMNIIAYSQPGVSPRGSFGKASQFYELKVFDDDDNECPPGVPGELVVRSRRPYMLLQGYYNLPEKTVEATRNLWFHSGDQGYYDEDGWFFFQDRLSDSIRRRGENISSYEVERIVNSHDAVAESAAVAVPSELQEDEVKLVAVRTPGANLTEEQLLRFCVDAMPYFMVPRFIEFKTELPRTPLTKVRKVVLRGEGVTAETWDCERHGLRITRRGLVESERS